MTEYGTHTHTHTHTHTAAVNTPCFHAGDTGSSPGVPTKIPHECGHTGFELGRAVVCHVCHTCWQSPGQEEGSAWQGGATQAHLDLRTGAKAT